METASAEHRDLVEGSSTSRPPLVVYVHIPRTAGTTVGTVFDPEYPPSTVGAAGSIFRNPQKAAEQVRRLGERDDQEIRLVSDALPYGLLRAHLPANSRYFTVLREPVDRTLSHYHSLIKSGREVTQYLPTREGPRPLPLPTPDTPLEQMLEKGLYLLDNLATRMLWGGESPFGELPSNAIELAKRNLSEEFELVGITERLDESIVLLERELGLGPVPYTSQNVNGNRPPLEEVPEAERLLIEDHNRLDLELYSFGLALLEQRVAAAGEDFRVEVDELSRSSLGPDHPEARIQRRRGPGKQAPPKAAPGTRRPIADVRFRKTKAEVKEGFSGASTAESAPQVVYVHIPNASGVKNLSDTWIFLPDHSPSPIRDAADAFHHPEEKALSDLRRLTAVGQETPVLSCAVPYGLLRAHLPVESRYVTLIREPVNGMLSDYDQLLATARWGDRHVATREGPRVLPPPTSDTSLEEMLKRGVYFLDNLATRMFWGGESVYSELPSGALEQAKQNLRERFEFVGIAEMLLESFVLLERAVGLGLVPRRHRKVVGNDRALEVSEDQRALIAEYNRLDLELYAFALELFEQRVDAAGDGFGPEVEKVRLLTVERAEIDPNSRFRAVPESAKRARLEVTDNIVPSREGKRVSAAKGPRKRIRLCEERSSAEIKFFGHTAEDVEELGRIAGPLDVRFGTPPIYRFENLVYRARSDCLYDEEGRRVLETCCPRGPGLTEIRRKAPGVISVPNDLPLIEHPVVYCGNLSTHWGLFLIESMGRLWALSGNDMPSDTPIIGSQANVELARPRASSAEHSKEDLKTGDFISEFLQHAGIAHERFIEFPEAVRLKEVFVPHPSFALRGQAFTAHAALPERVAEQICGSKPARTEQPVYLSRSKLPRQGALRFYGEEALDAVLRERGVRVVHPEQMTFEEQVRMFNEHSNFIGCNGSAFHSLMYALPDRPLRTIMIDNSVNHHLATYFMIDLIKNVEANYVYIEALDRPGRKPIGTLDVGAAVEWLSALSAI